MEGSTLEMYRTALGLRRELTLGRPEQPVVFEEDLPEGVLGVTRGALTVLVNTTSAAVSLPAGHRLAGAEVLVASAETTPGTLPADSAAWVRVG